MRRSFKQQSDGADEEDVPDGFDALAEEERNHGDFESAVGSEVNEKDGNGGLMCCGSGDDGRDGAAAISLRHVASGRRVAHS